MTQGKAGLVQVLRPGQVWPRRQDEVPTHSRVLRGLAQVRSTSLPDDAPPLALARDGDWIAATPVGGRLAAAVRYRAVVETVISTGSGPVSRGAGATEAHGAALAEVLQEASFRLAHRADHVLARTLAQLAGWRLGERRAAPGETLLLPLSQGALASLAGASRRLVSLHLQRMEALGRLATGHGRLCLNDVAAWDGLWRLPVERFVTAWEGWLASPPGPSL